MNKGTDKDSPQDMEGVNSSPFDDSQAADDPSQAVMASLVAGALPKPPSSPPPPRPPTKAEEPPEKKPRGRGGPIHQKYINAPEDPKTLEEVAPNCRPVFVQEWEAHADTVLNGAADFPRQDNRWVYDRTLGLGVLARFWLLRDIFRIMMVRDGFMPEDVEAANMLMATRNFYEKVASTKCLSLKEITAEDEDHPFTQDVAAAQALRDPLWQKILCDGLRPDRSPDAPLEIGDRTLNSWFQSRYQQSIPSGRMTPELLFQTRFSGKDAPARFVRMVLTGHYSPGTNRSLLPTMALKLPSSHADVLQSVIDHIASQDNKGRPIISIRSPGSPTLATSFASNLIARLAGQEGVDCSVCYVPIDRHARGFRLNDSGFDSIVDALYGYVNGHADLGTARQDPGMDVLDKVAAIREHLALLNNFVIIFDGYHASPGPFPSLIDCIRNEPLARLLRLLQHPSMGDSFPPRSPREFRKGFFVVLGESSPRWLPMHQGESLELVSDADGTACILERFPGLAQSCKLQLDKLSDVETSEIREWQLHLLHFLLSTQEQKTVEALQTDALLNDRLRAALRQYCNGLPDWQQLILWALSLSESGLRLSTIHQILECYGRLAGKLKLSASPGRVTSTELLGFLDKVASGPSALLVRYQDGQSGDEVDAFDHPSQAITQLRDFDNDWKLDKTLMGLGKGNTIDFHGLHAKNHVKELIRPIERYALRRIMSELRLQSYRIFKANTSFSRRDEAHARRILVEAVFHGILSLPIEEHLTPEGLKCDHLIREIPADAVQAFACLYFKIYRDTLCQGNLNHISTRLADGNLEMDLLLFFSHPREPDTAPTAVEMAQQSVCTPPWLARAAGQASTSSHLAAYAHLDAICRVASRCAQLPVLAAAISALEKLIKVSTEASSRAKPGRTVLTHQQLVCAKWEIDLLMRREEGPRSEREAAKLLMSKTIDLIVQCTDVKNAGDVTHRVQEIRATIRQLRQGVKQYIAGCWQLPRELRPNEARLDELVDQAYERIIDQAPAHKLPPEAVSILTRLAILTARVADSQRRGGKTRGALQTYFAALCIFWLAKKVATTRMEANPRAEPSKVSAQTAEELLRVTVLLQGLLLADNLGLDRGMESRLERSMRRTIDTFNREHIDSLANHIATPIFESTHARYTADNAKLMQVSIDGVPGDMRLAVVQRCLRGLKHAEEDMLPVTGRPSLRILFCEERIRCLLDALDRLCGPGGARHARTAPAQWAPWATSFLDWIGNDLLQVDAFTQFMAKAARDKVVWRSTLKELAIEVVQRFESWRRFSMDPTWSLALDSLKKVLSELSSLDKETQTGVREALSLHAAPSLAKTGKRAAARPR